MSDDLTYRHIYLPPADPAAGALLLLHGTGGDERDLLPLGASLAGVDDNRRPLMGLLSPRGDVIEQGMPRFFRRLAPGVFDEADIVYRAGRLAAFVAEAASEYGFEPDRVVAAGFSNGANIAAAVMLLNPDALRAAALFAPMTPLVPSAPPVLDGHEVFIAAGQSDPIAPREDTERLAKLLRHYGADVVLNWYGGGHTITAQAVHDAQQWLADLTTAAA